MGRLDGMRVAFFAVDLGTEQSELIIPWGCFHEQGAALELVALEPGEIQMLEHLTPARRLRVDRTVEDADPQAYDGLVLPGGVVGPDRARMNDDAVEFIRTFMEHDKPVAAICHAPWMLVEADMVNGRRLTSWPSVKTDIRNAGGRWVDRPVVRDGNLVTSRKPDDLDAFCAEAIEVFAGALSPRRAADARGGRR